VVLKLNGSHQLLAYVDDVNVLEDKIYTISKNTGTLINASEDVGMEINVEKLSICCFLIARMQVKIRT
jgi:hypothetical protein